MILQRKEYETARKQIIQLEGELKLGAQPNLWLLDIKTTAQDELPESLVHLGSHA